MILIDYVRLAFCIIEAPLVITLCVYLMLIMRHK